MTSNSHQAFIGILAAFLCAVFIFGSAALSLLEGSSVSIPEMWPTVWSGPRLIPTQPAPSQVPLVVPVTETVSEELSVTVAIATPASPTQSAFLPTIEVSTRTCAPPPGWVVYSIRGGDTLAGLASVYGVTPELLAWNNCLVIDSLIPGTILYVPFDTAAGGLPPALVFSPPVSEKLPSRPAVSRPSCGAPPGWVMYRVQRGDTLYALSQLLHVTVKQLQQANCLGSSTLIRTGQTLFVPFIPVRPVKPTPAPTDAPTTAPATQPPAETTPVETTPAPATEDPPPVETTEVVQPDSEAGNLAKPGKEVAPLLLQSSHAESLYSLMLSLASIGQTVLRCALFANCFSI